MTQMNESQLMSIVRSFKRKNPGLPEKEFKSIMDEAKGRATAHVQTLIDTAWKGTTKFGTEDIYSRQGTVEKPEVNYNQNIKLAEKYGLKLKAPNERGLQYLETDKNFNPVFSEEFKKTHDVKEYPLDKEGNPKSITEEQRKNLPKTQRMSK